MFAASPTLDRIVSPSHNPATLDRIAAAHPKALRPPPRPALRRAPPAARQTRQVLAQTRSRPRDCGREAGGSQAPRLET